MSRSSRQPAGLSILIYTALSIFPLIGFFVMWLGIQNVWRAYQSDRWPRVDGRVVSAEMRQGAGKQPMYQAQIRIAYKAGGGEYTTDNLLFGRTLGSGDSSEAELEKMRYQPGRKVSVSYNPSNPSEAVVHPGLHSQLFWLLGGGLAFLLPGVMFLVLYRSSTGASSGGLRTGLAMFGLVFLLIGTPMLIAGGMRLVRAWQSPGWPTTDGTIIYDKRDTTESVTRDEDGDTVRSESHSAQLVYKYAIDGEIYYNNVRQFGQLAGSDEDWADDIAERYPVGQKVKVAYLPDAPETSVLEPGIHRESWFLPGAGAAFFLFGLAVLVFPVRKKWL